MFKVDPLYYQDKWNAHVQSDVLWCRWLCCARCLPRGFHPLENVMTRGVDTLATIFSSLSGVIEASIKDFMNMLRNLSRCCSDVSKRPKIETCASVLDSCSTKNRWDLQNSCFENLILFLLFYFSDCLCTSISVSSSIIFSFPLPSGCRYVTGLETTPTG